MSSSNADGEDLLSEASTADVNNTMAASAPSHPPPPPFNPLQGGEEVIVSSNDRLKVNNAEETTGRLPHEITHESSSGGMTMTMAAHPSSLAARIVPPPLPLAISSSGGIQHSVVPDLMRVYESLTQSSTPQTTAPPPQKDTPEQSSQPGSQSQEAQHAEATMGQDASVEPYPYYSAPQGEEGHEGWHAPGTASAWTAPHEANPTSIPIPPPMHQVPPMEMQPSQSSRPSRSSGRSSAAERIAEAPTHNRSLRKRKQEAIEANYPSSGNSSGGSSSRGGGASKSRRKSGKSKGDVGDGRWSKRFTWPEELHRDFVSAIFDVGLQHSSPSTVLEHMPPHEQINSERIKSHLQKYRLHRQKSKKEFMSQYAASLQQFQKSGLEGVTSLAAGQVAGHLAYAALTLPDPVVPQEEPGGDTTAQQQRPGQSQKAPSYPSQQDMLVLPRLTEEEKQSPVGVAMGYLMGLFFSLKQQLNLQRQQQAAVAKVQRQQQTAVTVFDSFVDGAAPAASMPAPATQPSPGTVAATAAPSSSHATRSNLDETSMMKREMENQMVFQNKMRALKQQELQKYHKMAGKSEEAEKVTTTDMPSQHDHQGAGENVTSANAQRDRTHSMSMMTGGDDEFWNTDVVDEHLFEFLMND